MNIKNSENQTVEKTARKRSPRTGVKVVFSQDDYARVSKVGKLAGVKNEDVLRFAFHLLRETSQQEGFDITTFIADLRKFANVSVENHSSNPFE